MCLIVSITTDLYTRITSLSPLTFAKSRRCCKFVPTNCELQLTCIKSYDEAQLLSSALDCAQILPKDSAERETLKSMALDIVTYISRDLRSREGGFYSAEDADSLPSNDSTIKKEGAFYVWTAALIDEILGDRSEMFKYHFGVKQEGNCDPKHDIQGELKGQVSCEAG